MNMNNQQLLEQMQALLAQANGGQAQPQREALIQEPSAEQMGGQGPVKFVRFPFFPTSPWMSTNPNVGNQIRVYSTRLASTDGDFSVGSEVTRSIQFGKSCRAIAFNGAAYPTDWTSPPTIGGVNFLPDRNNMNLLYLFRVEYSSGDKLHTNARSAETVVGNGTDPGEIGGHGYNIAGGASLQISITPLLAGITIDISIPCLEMQPPANFSIR